MVLIDMNGNKERIDNFCGTNLPAQVMSNGPVLTIEFISVRRDGNNRLNLGHQQQHSMSSSSLNNNNYISGNGVNQNFRGFRATYKFLTGNWILPPLCLLCCTKFALCTL